MLAIGTGVDRTGETGVVDGVEEGGAAAAVNGMELGQLVIKPGFCGT